VGEEVFALGGDRPGLRVTLSVGIALSAAGSGESARSLIDRADAALYGAKAEGRDQVTRSQIQVAGSTRA
jgi:two-component system cell cycle response regulator